MGNIEEGVCYKVIGIPLLWPEALIKFLMHLLKNHCNIRIVTSNRKITSIWPEALWKLLIVFYCVLLI